jgi:hypothetical protein
MNTEQSNPSIFKISLTLLGDHLDPSKVSEILGMEPDRSWRKGDRASKDPAIIRERRTGIWKIIVTTTPESLNSDFRDLLSRFSECQAFSDFIPEIQQSKLAIFFAAAAQQVNSLDLRVDHQSIAIMARLGVEFYTVVAFDSDEDEPASL